MRIFLLSLLCIILCCVSLRAQDLPQLKPINPEFTEYLRKKQANENLMITSEGHYMGSIPSPKVVDFTDFYKTYKPDQIRSFPARFDLRDAGKVTSVKDQGNCGSCWSFAATAAVESRWLMLGYPASDLSEQNLNNCHGFVWGHCDGGTSDFTTAYYARRSGPPSEADDPYNIYSSTCNNKGYVAYVAEIRWLPKVTDVIKQYLMDYGGISTYYYHDDAYYNATNKTYYYNGSANTNHSVMLAGWDDNKVTAGGTGAWIIKNSWGTGWGEAGYFYISYNDTKVLSSNVVHSLRIEKNPFSEVYYYDKLGWLNDVGYGTNTAYGLTKYVSTAEQKITAIGVYTNSSNTSLDIEIYDTFSGGTLSSLLGSITNQTKTYPGYYTIELPAPLSISAGNDFYIKVKYYTPSYTYPIPIECAWSGYSNPTIETGVCWISPDGTSWSAIGGGTSYLWDLTIKAYAVQSVIIVNTPNGGETLPIGSIQTITWTSSGITGNVKIELSRDGGSSYETLFADTPDDGTESWNVTGPISSAALIRITSVSLPSVSDVSDANFSIAQPILTVTVPNGSENLPIGANQAIQWTSSNLPGNVKIELSRNAGSSYETLFADTPNDGTESWNVTGPISSAALIRITSVSIPSVSDVSDASFSIVQPIITVTVPNGSENWQIGGSEGIQWTSSNITGNVKIELSRNGGSTYETLFAGTTNDGSESWNVTGSISSAALIRITSVSIPLVSDVSDANFSIVQPIITVTVPNGSENWPIGTNQEIEWTSSNVPGNVMIELSRNAGSSYETLFADTPNDGTESWNVTGPNSSAAQIRITSVSIPSVNDVSDANFSIGFSSVSGKKFGDLDGNGLRNEGELGLPGWTIHLTGPISSSKITDENGNYSFTELPPGTYTISEENQTGWTQTSQSHPPIVLTGGEDISNIDFGNRFTISLSVNKGWNMVSIPITVPNYQKNVLFPTAVSDALAYQLSYVSISTLSNGMGYWLKFSSAQTVQLAGLPRLQEIIDVQAGWNMIGSISGNILTSSVVQIPDGNLISSYFGYTSSYQISSIIESGKGYWAKVGDYGQMSLSSGSLLQKLSFGDQFEKELSEATRIHFEDNVGTHQTLYVSPRSNHVMDINLFQLPPCPPEGIFDVRYSSGKMLEYFNEGKMQDFPLLLSTDHYPISVWIESSGKLSSISLHTSDRSLPLQSDTKVLLSNPTKKLSIHIGGQNKIPTTFSLTQNYPNPFNPTTTLSFDLPSDAVVTLKFYNLVGQEVATVLNRQEYSAGTYEQPFDASQLATGVYLYRIVAEQIGDDGNTGRSFTQVKKMVLIR